MKKPYNDKKFLQSFVSTDIGAQLGGAPGGHPPPPAPALRKRAAAGGRYRLPV